MISMENPINVIIVPVFMVLYYILFRKTFLFFYYIVVNILFNMLKNKIYMLICVFIILGFAFLSSYSNQKIVFLGKQRLCDFLLSDSDNYYKTFTKQDRMVRKIDNINDYHRLIEQSVGEFTPTQKESISKCVEIADGFFKGIETPWFHGYRASQIPWKFGCVVGNKYEEGLPHTRLDTIILPSNAVNQPDKALVSLLIHEKVHVYQKCYPGDISRYSQKYNLTIVGKRTTTDNIRANPDTNSDIYGSNSGTIFAMEYNANPTSISDTRGDGKQDHPNEKMAYEIAGMYNN